MVRDAMQLPDDPNDLAALVMDDSQPPEVVNRAWEKLMPLIMQIARRVALRLGMSDGQACEFAEDSSGTVFTVLQKKEYDPARRTFQKWLRTVLQRKAIDKIRKLARRNEKLTSELQRLKTQPDGNNSHDDTPEVFDQADPKAYDERGGGTGEQSVTFEETLKEISQCIRSGLDKAAMFPVRRVDYFAALLLLLRLNALNLFTSMVHVRDPHAESENLVPWSMYEMNLCIAPNYPSIQEIWQEVKSNNIMAIELCELVRFLKGQDGQEVAYTNLAMWFHRAKTLARKAIGDELWRKCGFERLTSFRKADQS